MPGIIEEQVGCVPSQTLSFSASPAVKSFIAFRWDSLLHLCPRSPSHTMLTLSPLIIFPINKLFNSIQCSYCPHSFSESFCFFPLQLTLVRSVNECKKTLLPLNAVEILFSNSYLCNVFWPELMVALKQALESTITKVKPTFNWRKPVAEPSNPGHRQIGEEVKRSQDMMEGLTLCIHVGTSAIL